MLAELAFLVLSLAPAPAPTLAAWMSLSGWATSPTKTEVTYKPDERAVTNWRGEASRSLDLDPSIATAFAEGGDPRPVSRCVKLNNYWCIKGAGWNGMLAADAEGHAAFASAPEGAAVAALLLRRYYLDFSRRSAQAIVSRWAPAQCGGMAFAPSRSPVRTTQFGKGFRLAQTRPTLGPAPLATHGLGNTLRARFLASRGRGIRLAKGSRPGIRRSVVADRTPPMLRTPRITAGIGSIELALAPRSSLSLLLLASRVTPASFAPLTSCAGDGVRIRNYALKVIEGVANSPDDDLKLFEPDGTPTGNLARVMANMASVEIGPLRADPALVKIGIETATTAAKLAAEANAARAANTEPGAAR